MKYMLREDVLSPIHGNLLKRILSQ